MKSRLGIAGGLAIILAASPALGWFEKGGVTGVGARPLGMGGAYAAVCDDTAAVFWNPAGLGQLSRAELSGMYAAIFNGKIFYLFSSAAFPILEDGFLGLSWERRDHVDSPGKAKNYAHTIELREDWESPVGTPALHAMFTDEWGCAVELTKDHFMYSALIAKFTQHEDLRRGLLATGSAILVEDTIGDPYWGNGPSQNGLNKLGRQLMFVRKRLLETV